MGIESSCDETAIALLADGTEILSNVISSQIEIHKEYGGVVPEIASRHHLNNIPFVFDRALKEAGVELKEVDEIGVTAGPGLAGALDSSDAAKQAGQLPVLAGGAVIYAALSFLGAKRAAANFEKVDL